MPATAKPEVTWKAFSPEVTITTEGPLYAVLGQEIEIPFAWTDGVVYLHAENPGSAYSLWLNDRQVAEVSDPLTPAEFDLTPYIREGVNDFKLLMRSDNPARQLDAEAPAARKPFENSYLDHQNKRSIADFEIGLVPDTLGRNFGMLDLRIVAQNAFNYDEPVTVGYDIYSPQAQAARIQHDRDHHSGPLDRHSALLTVHLPHLRQQVGGRKQDAAALQGDAFHAPQRCLQGVHADEDRVRQDRTDRRTHHCGWARSSNSKRPATTPRPTARPPSQSSKH